VEAVKEIAGHGLKGRVTGKEVLVGNARLLRQFGVSFDETLTQIPYTVIMTAVDGRFAGHFLIADALKPGAAEAVSQLKRDGIRTVMLSGDKSAVVEAVGRR
jgi:Zn2+/Cd2+-exporting ATPase